ncbi:MAG TPA: hypothetical protein VJ742_07230 [Nitrososphaera sp.]|nr:hypothetical protein [Nitrososphaera sp.]
MLNLLDEIDGRLTGMTIRWPELRPEMLKIQKHVKYALNNDKITDLRQYLTDTRGRMTAAMVRFPELQEYFRPLTEKITKELGG